MTRKDYELIARALERSRLKGTTARQQYRATVYAVADNLAHENPRFDHQRFLEACGIY